MPKQMDGFRSFISKCQRAHFSWFYKNKQSRVVHSSALSSQNQKTAYFPQFWKKQAEPCGHSSALSSQKSKVRYYAAFSISNQDKSTSFYREWWQTPPLILIKYYSTWILSFVKGHLVTLLVHNIHNKTPSFLHSKSPGQMPQAFLSISALPNR